MDMRSIMDLIPQADPEEFESALVEEPRGRQSLLEDAVLDETNEILRRDNRSPQPDPGQKVVSFVLDAKVCRWTDFRRVLWGMEGSHPSMRFQVLNRRSKNPTFFILGLPDDVDAAIQALQTEYDARREEYMARHAPPAGEPQAEATPAPELAVATVIGS
jgi:hypothetical protein